MQAGPVGSFLSRPEPADSCWPSWLATTSACSQSIDGRKIDGVVLPADLLVVERGLDRRTHARLVGDVGGEEHLHLARDLLDAWSTSSPESPSACGPARMNSSPSTPPLERGEQRLVRAAHLVRHVEALGLRAAGRNCVLNEEIALCRSAEIALPPSPSRRKNSAPVCLLDSPAIVETSRL